MHLGEFNALGADEARAHLDACLGVRRWVDEVAAARPYADMAALVVRAKASAENLSDEELDAALARHPRIGKASGDDSTRIGETSRDGSEREAAFSHAEQSGVAAADAAQQRLRTGNQRYEERFGRVFLVRAAGRSGAEVLAELDRRIDNDPAAERREVGGALRDIAVLRLQQVVHG